jgi:ATP-dependent Clp protease ATP-binding subunit ClpA
MKIENIKNIDDLNMFVDAIDNELMDRSDASAIDTSVSNNKKEEKKLTVEYFGTDLTKEVKDGFIDPII